MAGGEIMAEADDLVDEEGGRIRRDPPRRGVSQQPELNLGAAGFQSLFEQIDHRAATLAGIACFPGDLIEPRRQRAAVDDRAAVFALVEEIAHDRKNVVSGKRVSVRVDLGGTRLINKNKKQTNTKN